MVKNPRPGRRPEFDPWVGKIPWRRAWQPTLVFFPGGSPWTEEPDGLHAMWLQRVRQDWTTKYSTVTEKCWRTDGSEGVRKESSCEVTCAPLFPGHSYYLPGDTLSEVHPSKQTNKWKRKTGGKEKSVSLCAVLAACVFAGPRQWVMHCTCSVNSPPVPSRQS